MSGNSQNAGSPAINPQAPVEFIPGLDLVFPSNGGPVYQKSPGGPWPSGAKAVIPAGEPDFQRPWVDATQARHTILSHRANVYLNRTLDQWFTPQEHLSGFTSKVLVLPRGPHWDEAISSALMSDWDGPRRRREPDALVGKIRAEARAFHRQLVPLWDHRVRKSRVLLLETPIGEGLTLLDVVAGGPREDLVFEAAFDDPRIAAVLAGMTPDERAVVMAWAHMGVGSWTEAARLAGRTSPEKFGERVRRKLKRLGANHTVRVAAISSTENS